ncbi:MAG: biotin--[acetyl-CoA-carboxylase] ligase [Flavobacteriaceae bacterium]
MMHNFNLIKIDATDSTNSWMKKRYSTNKCSDGDVVWSQAQNIGRGQGNSIWLSEKGKNLTISIYKEFNDLEIHNPFLLSSIVSLTVAATLNLYRIPKVCVKWPNDIMSGDKKVCGILIENIFKKSTLRASIIGVGLNVNQNHFENLFQASSMSQISGLFYDLDEVINCFLDQLEQKFELLNQPQEQIIKIYETSLYRKNKPSTFESKGSLFSGVIKGVTPEGLLKVEQEDHKIYFYNLKQIKLKN